jgi:hypothetical protein
LEFLFARRAAAPLRTVARLVAGLLPFLAILFAVPRARGFAAAIFSVNAFCTDPALAAIVPSVAPIDSATLVRIASSFDDLWLSMAHPLC